MGKRSKRSPKESFERRRNTRQPKDIILIVCEGKETEPRYFRVLRGEKKLSNVEVKIVEGSGGSQTAVIDKAADIQRQNPDLQYDQIWCVFDCEGRDKALQFKKAQEQGEKSRYKLAISNPCFEYWLLLHFEFSDAPFHSYGEIEKKLKRHLPSYHKSMDFRQLLEKVDTAIQNAKRLKAPDGTTNPSTTVQLLVESVFRNKEN